MFDARGADDRRVDPVLVEHPRERDLGHRRPLVVRDLLDAFVDLLATVRRVGVFSGVLVGLPTRGGVELLVGAGEVAPRERAPRDHPDVLLLAERQHLALLLAVGEAVVVLHRREPFEVQRIAGVEGLRELVGPHRRAADVAHLIPADGVVERLQGLLDRRVVVPPMGLIEVDGIYPEPVEGVLEFLLDGLPGEPLCVGVVVVHRIEDLGGEHQPVAVVARERVADDALGLAPGVHVRRVEEVDPEVHRFVDDLLAFVLVEHPLAPVRTPEAHTAETDPAHAHSRVAERRILHAPASTAARKNLFGMIFGSVPRRALERTDAATGR